MTTTISLDQILSLTGRLDDESRFDAPRERFRRFVSDYVRDVQTARDLIEQGQFSPSPQHQRAVQDLIVLLGRFLGFKPAFGADSHRSPMRHAGHWQSPEHLQIAIDVRSDQAVDGSEPAGGAEPLPAGGAEPPRAGGAESPALRTAALCVVTPLCMNRQKIEATFVAAWPGVPASVVAMRSLLSLADSVAAGRMSHDDLVRLIQSGMSLDFIVELLDRAATTAAAIGEAPVPELTAGETPSYWVCSVASDYGTKPEEFLELVVAKRLIFGIASDVQSTHTIHLGDRICFYIAGKGMVGHARIAAPADVGRGLRDAHRFRQVLQLEDLHLFLDKPIAPDAETQLRLRTARAAPGQHSQTLVEISRDSYETMMAAGSSTAPLDHLGVSKL